MKKIVAYKSLGDRRGLAIFVARGGQVLSAFCHDGEYDKSVWCRVRKDDDGRLYFVRYRVKYFLDEFVAE